MKTEQSKSMSKKPRGDESALKEFFIDSLKDIYRAEKNLVKALPKMAKKATSEELKSALEKHLSETENQVSRLEQVFLSIGEKAAAKKCEAMEGLIAESETIISDTENGSMTRDVGIIAACQKVEHYEIASYGTMRTLADVLGLAEVSKLLNDTLEEEKKADATLTQIAEGFVNEYAAKEEKE